MSDRDKDVEILVLRHQITVLDRRPGKKRVRFHPVIGHSWRRRCTSSRRTCCPGCGR
ncbi:hypothetical protein ACWDBD_48890 [Streptomyces sp. NPDC001118]